MTISIQEQQPLLFFEWPEAPHPKTNGPASQQSGYRRLRPRCLRPSRWIQQLRLPFDDQDVTATTDDRLGQRGPIGYRVG